MGEGMRYGRVQMGDSWPGIFIPGDEALSMANDMDVMAAKLGKDGWHGIIANWLRRRAADFRKCRINPGRENHMIGKLL